MHVPDWTQAHRISTLVGEEEFLQRIDRVINQGDVYWDVGASIGTHSLPFTDRARVFAFEPDPESSKVLCINNRLNGGNLTVIEAALSDEDGTLDLQTSGTNGMAPTINTWNSGIEFAQTVQVPSRRAVSLVRNGRNTSSTYLC